MQLFKKNNQSNQPRNNPPGRRPGVDRANVGRNPVRLRRDEVATSMRVRDSRQRMSQMGQNRTFSYYAARSQAEVTIGREPLQSKPPIRRLPTRLQRLRAHARWFAAGATLLAFIIFELQLSTTPRVIALAKTSDAPFLQDTSVYQQAAKKIFEATATNRNKLTVNTSDISVLMRKQFPELDQVSVTLPVIGDMPVVYVRPADPALVLAVANGVFVVDEHGRALADVSGGATLAQMSRLGVPTVTDRSSMSAKLGQQVLPTSAAEFIAAVTALLKAKGVNAQAMTLPAAAGELNVYLAGQTYFVKFNIQEGGAEAARVQAGTFLAVKHQLGQQGKQPGQYVDVRLAGRAYWK